MGYRQFEQRRISCGPSATLSAVLLVGGATVLSSGCGRSAHVDVYPVDGLLTVNGQPAAKANLAFHPLDRSASAPCPVGQTDARGHFRVTTLANGDGAPAGDYAV